MKYTMNICLGDRIWTKPIPIKKDDYFDAMKNLDNGGFKDYELRIEEDENWKLTYHIYYATGETNARVVFCKEEEKRRTRDD